MLVERDIDTWYSSFDKGVISALYTWTVWVLMTFIDPIRGPKPATTMKNMQYGMFQCFDRESFQARSKPTYREHYAKVRRLVSKDKLLDYKLGSGWEPLCKFLGKEIPQTPFPHLNESKEFEIWMGKIQRRELKKGLRYMWRIVVLPMLIIGIFYSIWMFLSKQ